MPPGSAIRRRNHARARTHRQPKLVQSQRMTARRCAERPKLRAAGPAPYRAIVARISRFAPENSRASWKRKSPQGALAPCTTTRFSRNPTILTRRARRCQRRRRPPSGSRRPGKRGDKRRRASSSLPSGPTSRAGGPGSAARGGSDTQVYTSRPSRPAASPCSLLAPLRRGSPAGPLSALRCAAHFRLWTRGPPPVCMKISR